MKPTALSAHRCTLDRVSHPQVISVSAPLTFAAGAVNSYIAHMQPPPAGELVTQLALLVVYKIDESLDATGSDRQNGRFVGRPSERAGLR